MVVFEPVPVQGLRFKVAYLIVLLIFQRFLNMRVLSSLAIV